MKKIKHRYNCLETQMKSFPNTRMLFAKMPSFSSLRDYSSVEFSSMTCDKKSANCFL